MNKGTKVKMVNCGEAEHYQDRIWITRTNSFFPKNYPNEEVIFLEGFSGWFLCEYLEIIN